MMAKLGVTLILNLGWVGFDFSIDKRGFKLYLGIIGLRITFFNFVQRLERMLEAFNELARLCDVKATDYLDSYINRYYSFRKKQKK